MIEVVGKDKKARTVTVTVGEYLDIIPAKLPEKASFEKARAKAKPPVPPKKDGKKDKKDVKKEEKKEDKDAKEDKEKGKAPTGLLKRTNQARDRHYWIYVPEDYNPDISYALVIWLHPVGKNKDRDVDAITLAWDDYCSKNHVTCARCHLVGLASGIDCTTWSSADSDAARRSVSARTERKDFSQNCRGSSQGLSVWAFIPAVGAA